MSKFMSYQPDTVSPPGETITEMLQERDMTPDQLAAALGWTEEQVADLLSGKMRINTGIADKLAETVGLYRGFWLRREVRYRQSVGARRVSCFLEGMRG